MVQTWKSGDAGEFECPNCGSMYRRTVRRLPARDEDQAECEVCGAIMDSWDSTEVPSYTLIKPKGADI
jgi:ribosomal protein L37AE/L43A